MGMLVCCGVIHRDSSFILSSVGHVGESESAGRLT